MSKQMRKTIGIFLAVCFLMSITAVAVNADPVEKTNLTDKNMTGMKLEKGLSQGKDVHIKNLVIIRNLVIIKSNREHPILRAAVLKNLMTNKMNKTGMTDNTGMTDESGITDKTDNTGMTDNNTDNTT
jgi:hypothetical protein